jgi:glycosyltransferase involved in cell wall biosynthesis
MYQPLITIGISTYNRATSLLEYSLPTIAELTYPNYEVIVVNDSSSDETLEVLNEYQNKISNIRIFCNERNRGLCYSRNRILKESKGEIIVFTDDDVSLFPDCLDEIAKVYLHNPEVVFIWGCVYQCHGSHDRNQPTFGSGSLFSIKSIVSKHFQFDTNIRYFKTYGCEEHEFSRRVKKTQAKFIKGEMVKANHYQSPAKNRAWRGLGGDLNYLYEQVKRGSILHYYGCLMLGLIYVIHKFFKRDLSWKTYTNSYKSSLESFYTILLLIRERKLLIASKYIYYVTIDIPIRAWNRRRLELKQIQNFIQDYQKYQQEIEE